MELELNGGLLGGDGEFQKLLTSGSTTLHVLGGYVRGTAVVAPRGTTSSAVRPEGNSSTATSIHSGRDAGARF